MTQMPRSIQVDEISPAPEVYFFWRKEEDDILREGLSLGKSDNEILHLLPGRTIRGIVYRRKHLRLLRAPKRSPPIPWTEGEIIDLEVYFYEGKSNEEIAEIMKRSPRFVRSKLTAMGLSRTKARSLAPAQPQIVIKSIERFKAMIATYKHLLDLKRAGHSPTRTELNVPSENVVSSRSFRPMDAHSGSGCALADLG